MRETTTKHEHEWADGMTPEQVQARSTGHPLMDAIRAEQRRQVCRYPSCGPCPINQPECASYQVEGVK